MKNPKISVIVPVYNTAEFLPECLDCFLNQTYKNFEVILVDDGSTDKSGILCDEYAKRDQRFIVIHKHNGGVSAARNTGLDAATGDYVGFVDSDDTFLAGMLEGYVAIAEETDADFIESINYIDENSSAKYGNVSFLHLYNNEEARKEFFSIGEVRPSVCLALIKRTIIGEERFPAHIVQWEDYAFIGLIISKSEKVAITSKLFYKYREREGSATNRPLNEKHLTCLLIDDYFKEQKVYKSEQEHYDVVGFFLRCCTLAIIGLDKKNEYSYRVLDMLRKDAISVRKSRAVPLREKIIVLSALVSVPMARILRNIIRKAVSILIGMRNRLWILKR